MNASNILGSYFKAVDSQQDVTYSIKYVAKRRATTKILCDQGVPLKLKGKFY